WRSLTLHRASSCRHPLSKRRVINSLKRETTIPIFFPLFLTGPSIVFIIPTDDPVYVSWFSDNFHWRYCAGFAEEFFPPQSNHNLPNQQFCGDCWLKDGFV